MRLETALLLVNYLRYPLVFRIQALAALVGGSLGLEQCIDSACNK